MKHSIIIQRLCLFLFALMLAAPAWSEDITIGSKYDWQQFCERLNSGRISRADVKLTADIDLGGDVIRAGVGGYYYQGTFDGQGHSISVNWDDSETSLSLFGFLNGATIKNLCVKGNISFGEAYVEGLAGEARNYTVISNCVFDLNIKNNYGWGTITGIVGTAWLGTLVIKDCVVKGSFTANSEHCKNRIKCFVGILEEDGKCTIENSLYIGSNNATGGSETFGPDGINIDNCYYLNACGKAQGTQITKEQLKSGEVAHKLQKGRSEHVWSQLIGTDNEPQPTAEASKHVYKVDFTYNNEVKVTRYVNNKIGSMPTVRDILGSAYVPKIIYALDFEGGFNGSTTVNADRTVAVTIGERIEIGSKDDWKTFCDLVNNGHTKLDAKLTQNVNLRGDITMAGNIDHNYSGTFDGQNHTLTVNWNTNANDIAPFRRVNGATIKNLHTEGTIKSSGYYLAGLIDEAYGESNISGCVSNVHITSTYDNGGCDAGGLISFISRNARVTITDCLVKGSINATMEKGKKGMGGFVSIQNGTCTLINCLYIGDNNATGGNTFADNATVTNCYYLNTCGTAQGTHVTADQLMSGEVAYKLQNGRNTQFWGQTLRTDDEPQLTDDAAKRVHEVKFSYNGNVVATRYATHGKAIYGVLPTEPDLLGTLYDPAKNYSITFEGGFNTGTAVDKDRTVAVTILVSNNFEIATKDDWKEFCRLVNSGKTKLNAKMIKDVDLGGDIAMVGAYPNRYAGTFDGQRHTLTLNWDAGESKDIAPFKSVKDCIIRNLRTKGKITSKGNWMSGLIDEVHGSVTISNCVSDVALKCSYNDNPCGAAGMISYMTKEGIVTITDCIVKGDITATTDECRKGIGGFVYGQHGTCTLTNCLYIGTNNADNTNGDSNTFANNATINNCYYLNACGTAQGTPVTKEQLKSGEVARLLQNGRSEDVWGQNLGTDDEPQLTNDAAKHVYKVDFTYNGNAAAARYANRGGHIFGALPTAKDLLGTAYNSYYYYALTFADDFSANTAVDADCTVAVTVVKKAIEDELEIASKDDWKIFCDAVNRGKKHFDVKMTADVDLGKDIIMVGEEMLIFYAGTFDGQGHTLKIDWNAGTQGDIAPFKCLGATTIKNLTVKGRITSDGHGLAGMVLYAIGELNVSNCISDVDITTGYDGESQMGGIVNFVIHNAQSVRFTDCVVKGKLHATKEAGRKCMGGFIAYRGGDMPCYFENCLYIGENNATFGDGGYTFGPNPVLTNSHYLKVCGIAQGEQVTEKQLKNGYVSDLLQKTRTDACHWAQVLGDMPSLYCETDKMKPNYVYYDTANYRWACENFVLTDGTLLPIGINFLAANVTYDRPFNSMGTATVCLPYELPHNGSFKAYTLSEKQGNSSTVRFTEVKNQIEANTPYLLVADGTPQLGGTNIEVRDWDIDIFKEAGEYKLMSAKNNMDNDAAAAANAYILQDDGKFHKVTAGNPAVTIPPYRAFITRNSSGAKEISIIFDGETTNIDGVTDGTLDTNGAVYDLQGRRMADRLDDNARRQLPAGVYIVGGRKVVVK